jgi:5,10-methylenetetrahydromethanopterin reductase
MRDTASVRFTFSNLPAVGWRLPAGDIVELARRCEDAGFDRFAVADLPFHYDCVAVMAACLVRTQRVVVESLVTNPFTREAAMTAAAWATLSSLSGGRAIFGIGAGVEVPRKVWISPWGHDRPRPVGAVREMVAVLRRLWRGETVTFDGDVVHVHDAALDCPLPPPIPVLVAARGPQMLTLAGEIADIVHLASLFLAPEHRSEDLARVEAGARRAGRAPDTYEVEVSVTVSASRDRERARHAARRNAAQTILWTSGKDPYGERQRRPPGFNVPGDVIAALAAGWNMWKDPDLPPDLAALMTDDLLDAFTVWGSPAECAQRLAAMTATLPGVTGIRVKLPLPVGSKILSSYVEDVDALGEVIAAYRVSARERAPMLPA